MIGCKALRGRFAWVVRRGKQVRTGQEDPRGTHQPDDGRIDLLRSQGSTGIPFRPGPQSSRGTRSSGSRKSECSQRQLRSIARIARVFDAPAGTILTRADEPGDEFFLILDGTASVDVATETRGPLRPGAFFGEMSLLDGGPRSATIVAETPVRLLVITRRNLSVLLEDVPGLTQSLL